MSRPNNITQYQPIELKLSIKSSLSDVKATLALLCLIYESSNEPDQIDISQSSGSLSIPDSTVEKNLVTLCHQYYSPCGDKDSDFQATIANNWLFKAQLESLIVTTELIWKISKISFIDSKKSNTAERTGRNRYPKKVTYSAYMDILSTIINSNKKTYYETLLNWIGMNTPLDNAAEETLCRTFTIFSEHAIFKLNDGTKDIVFNENELYQALTTNPDVDINDSVEKKGSLRILASALKEKMNPYLSYVSPGTVSVASGKQNDMEKYQKRVDALLSLLTIKIPVATSSSTITASMFNFKSGYKSNFDNNRVVFGAPGTGKSYLINQDKNVLIGTDGSFERVTFYADYTYAQFVGTYKPVNDDSGDIKYTFVPGPFMRLLANALSNIASATDVTTGIIDITKVKPFLIIIEEINRAKAAAVFGDVFQLIERDDDNVSEYEIHPSEEIKKYLAEELQDDPECFNSIRLPDNFFMWASMNSADQGVYPVDTAFKRRWSFKYIGVDEEEFKVEVDPSTSKKIATEYQSGVFTLADGDIEWNILRRAINAKLSSESIRVHEDKLMGPFFIKTMDKAGNIIFPIASKDNDFIELFCNKVLMYLFEDAAKTKRDDLFEGCNKEFLNRYSYVCELFKTEGLKIFGDNFKTDFYNKQKFERDKVKAEKEI